MFTGCQENEPAAPNATLNAIPFLTGQTNSYRYAFQMDSSGVTVLSAEDSFTIRIVSNNASVNGMTGLTLMEATRKGNSAVFERVWYRVSADSVAEVNYQFLSGTGVPIGAPIFPKGSSRSAGLNHALMSQPLGLQLFLKQAAAADTGTKRTDPRIVYRFPLTVGKQWLSFRDPFRQDREVLDIIPVTVPAGTFICTKIRSSTDPLPGPFEYFDYVSSEGLIQRTFDGTVAVTTETHPDGTGEFRQYRERLTLIAR